MRLSALLVLLALTVTGCRSSQPVAEADGEATWRDAQRLRVENERLRRRLDAAREAPEAEPVAEPEEAYRGETVEILLADLTFESGSASLTADGLERIDALAVRLKRDFAGRRVRVEGHTDTQPIGPALREVYPTNWELSTARATTVARYLQEAHGLDGDRLEAVGMGAYYPEGSNATAEGRTENRRVRVAVLPEREG